MASDDAHRVALEALLAHAVSPEDAMQALLRHFPRIRDRLDQIERELAFERSVFRQYGGPGDLELHREQVAPLERARETLLDAVRQGVTTSLRRRAGLAFGLRLPIDEASRHVAIAPVLWNALELDFARATARGGGREYRDVRIILCERSTEAKAQALDVLIERLTARAWRDAEPTRAARRDEAGTPAEEAGTPAPANASADEAAAGAGEQGQVMRRREPELSFPGRPSIMGAVEQEMRRRAERGELCPALAAECRALAAWAAEVYRGHQTPTAKAIENGLRSVYWQLRPRNTP